MDPRSAGGGLQFLRPGSHNAEALRALKRTDGGDGVKVRWSAVAAWLLWFFSAAGIGLGVAVQLRGGRTADLQVLSFVLAFAAYAMVGAVVASRRPRNPIGWVFLSVGVLTAIGSLGEAYAEAAFSRRGLCPPPHCSPPGRRRGTGTPSSAHPPCSPYSCSPRVCPQGSGARCCGSRSS